MAHFDENGYRVSTGQLFASAVSKALHQATESDGV